MTNDYGRLIYKRMIQKEYSKVNDVMQEEWFIMDDSFVINQSFDITSH
jgi:hypothetical protein